MEKIIVVWIQTCSFVMFCLRHSKPRGSSLSHFEHLHLGHSISLREKFSGPKCPALTSVNVFIGKWLFKQCALPCSCRDLHPPMRPVTATHWLRSVSLAEAVARFKEKVGKHFKKWNNKLMNIYCQSGQCLSAIILGLWSSSEGPEQGHWDILGPTWDPLSSDVFVTCKATYTISSVYIVQDVQHVQEVKPQVSFTPFSPAPRCALCGDFEWFRQISTQKSFSDEFLSDFASFCTSGGPSWAHLCEAGYGYSRACGKKLDTRNILKPIFLI